MVMWKRRVIARGVFGVSGRRPVVVANLRFRTDDKVKVTVFYFDDEGFSYAHAEKVSVL
ncbi:hypothetical protein Srufu_002650 [Streptomyces libani subsp. rufus]|nr:hypothetical protein Srufu_002650 [Streptomyces libani subsp. rufus]